MCVEAFLPSAFPVSQPGWVRWVRTWGLSPLSACLGGEIPKQAELDILWNNQVHPISMVLLWVFTLPLSALPYMQSKVLCFLSSWHLSSPAFYRELPETSTLIELPSPPPSSRDAAPTIHIQLSTCSPQRARNASLPLACSLTSRQWRPWLAFHWSPCGHLHMPQLMRVTSIPSMPFYWGGGMER